MNTSHVQALQCGALTSSFALEVLKYQEPDPLCHAGNTAFATTLLMEAFWLRSEGVVPRGVHLACNKARDMIEQARKEDSVDLVKLGLGHYQWMLVSSGSILPSPYHELFWVGYAIGGYTTWPTKFDVIGAADPGSLAHLRETALCGRHVNAVCRHDDIDVTKVEGLEKFLNKPADDGRGGMKELARKCHEQVSCCIPRPEPEGFGFRAKEDPR